MKRSILIIVVSIVAYSQLSHPALSGNEEKNFTLTENFDDWYYKKLERYQGWRYIVIHHSATAAGSVKGFDEYHTKQGFGGIAYHYVIGNGKGMKDGEVAETFRWQQQISGTHSTVNAWKHNIFGIGICLVGNFEKAAPTRKQLDALEKLVAELSQKYHIQSENIITHRDVPYDNDPTKFEQTLCPGKNFNLQALREKVSDKLAQFHQPTK